MSEPWETLGEKGETDLENLPLEDDSPNPWGIAGETEITAEFFDPDLLAIYRQLRFESPESPEIVSEADEGLENSTDWVLEERINPVDSPPISPVNGSPKTRNYPTFWNDYRTGK
ncbi:MAG: hypothetical protein ACKO1W_15335, partial [Microcystaceae cyanobacterium]